MQWQCQKIEHKNSTDTKNVKEEEVVTVCKLSAVDSERQFSFLDVTCCKLLLLVDLTVL